MFDRFKQWRNRLAAGVPDVWPAREVHDDGLDTLSCDLETDVVVIGLGGAGIAAAIEACDNGADVIALDRFAGGGSTRISGGIYYAGGGTRIQREAGFEDSPENMLNYLRQEAGDAVSEATLQRFCDDSVANFDWLAHNGVPFEASYCPFKTSYPSNLYYYYYSGNESFPPYSDVAEPAPRGHRAHGPGVSGAAFFNPLRQSLALREVPVLQQHKALRLLRASSGRVVGVECAAMRSGSVSGWVHRQLAALLVLLRYATIFAPFVNYLMRGVIEWLERNQAEPVTIRARRGVIIASGGFYANREMVAEHAPTYLSGIPLGTIGDDGSGILLGQSVGGTTGLMDSMSAWRFINPPQAFVKGLLVDARGQRVCNEMLYGAQLAERIMKQADGRAWLVIDRALFDEALGQIGPKRTMWFQSVGALMFLYLARRKASSLAELAGRIGVPAAELAASVAAYNQRIASGQADPLGKPAEFLAQLGTGPWYALDCTVDSLQGCPTLSLGGLRVDEDSGEVLGEDGVIPGLYAAGRSAVGVASRSYVSGLSIADCVFSGRRAGQHAASAGGS